jgi:hypothetical protein
MKLWLEVYVEPCPPHTGMFVAQEVVRYDDGRVSSTYLDSGVDRIDIMNKIQALGYKLNHHPILFVDHATCSR